MLQSVIWLDLMNWQVSGLSPGINLINIFLNVLGDGMECVPIWKEDNNLKKTQQRTIGDIENVTP